MRWRSPSQWGRIIGRYDFYASVLFNKIAFNLYPDEAHNQTTSYPQNPVDKPVFLL
ncbi:hypothetical protein PESP_a1459 [Pseudoalteromonas espejiana DSM 9414]|nr:hypothetical protein PESP_a1459 [Pseudoalteromonas espejiana DSM 9414]